MRHEKINLILITVTLLIVPIVTVACGGTAEDDAVTDAQTVSVQAVVTDIRLADDGKNAASIKIQTEEGKEFDVRIGDQIDPTVWGLPHLQGHKQLGHRIGVTYQQTPQGKVVIEFSER